MADALTVELVAADRTVWSGPATMVIAKTVDGDIGVLRGHAPVLSLLSESIVEITAEDGHTVFAVADGGFLSVANDRVSILSERAELARELHDIVGHHVTAIVVSAEAAKAQGADERTLDTIADLGRRALAELDTLVGSLREKGTAPTTRVSPRLSDLPALIEPLRSSGVSADLTTMLTERELTVLELLPSLLSLDEIATDLTLSVNTVKSDVRSIYTKLGVSSRRTAVRSAHEHGMLEHRA